MRFPAAALLGASVLFAAPSAFAEPPYPSEDRPPAPTRMKSPGAVAGGSFLILLGVVVMAVGVPVVIASANDTCLRSATICSRDLGMGLGAFGTFAGAVMLPAGSILVADGAYRVPEGAVGAAAIATRPWVQVGSGTAGGGLTLELRFLR